MCYNARIANKEGPTMTTMRERDIEAYLVARCRHVGALCYKWTSPGRVGVPDRICVFPDGRVVFVELKAPGRKPSPAQMREHARLREYGQKVVVVDSIEGVEHLMPRTNICNGLDEEALAKAR